MKTLRFEGCSDNTFGEYGVTNEDYDNCAACTPIQCIVDCGGHGRVMVIGQYSRASCNNGCWMIGISVVNEMDIFPDWNYRYQAGSSIYSTVMEMDVPDEFKLIWFNNGERAGV